LTKIGIFGTYENIPPGNPDSDANCIVLNGDVQIKHPLFGQKQMSLKRDSFQSGQ
jgi:hypothetical protein